MLRLQSLTLRLWSNLELCVEFCVSEAAAQSGQSLRAYQMVHFYASRLEGQPVVIYAGADKHESKSKRCVPTIAF